MEEIDVAVFAFDDQCRLKLVNRYGERILAQPSRRIIGRKASELGLSGFLEEDSSQTIDKAFPGKMNIRYITMAVIKRMFTHT